MYVREENVDGTEEDKFDFNQYNSLCYIHASSQCLMRVWEMTIGNSFTNFTNGYWLNKLWYFFHSCCSPINQPSHHHHHVERTSINPYLTVDSYKCRHVQQMHQMEIEFKLEFEGRWINCFISLLPAFFLCW